MGKKTDREVAARMMWAAQDMIESAAALIPYQDTRDGDTMRHLVLDKANEVRLLAGDVFHGGTGE